MDDITIGLIYAIKECKYGMDNHKDNAIAFFSDYTGVPKKYYVGTNLYTAIAECFIDYLGSHSHPIEQIRRFLDSKVWDHVKPYDDIDAMLALMAASQIKNNKGKYINGFRDIK